MTYKEEYGNLFDVHPDYWLCQCISADFGMGATEHFAELLEKENEWLLEGGENYNSHTTDYYS